jgi:hypothetical protein
MSTALQLTNERSMTELQKRLGTLHEVEPVDEGFYFKGLAVGPGISRDEAVDLIELVQQGEARITVAVTTGDGTTRLLPFQPMQMYFCG